jgi:hypothetical protein
LPFNETEQKELTPHPLLIEPNIRSPESLRIIALETFQELVVPKSYKNSQAEQAG